MTLLSGLDAVDWAALSHAYGPAADVPALLRGLVDSDPARAGEALHELWGTVWHQGTVYDCTPVVVPFLVEVLQSKEVDDRARPEVALLVASIASATSFVLGERPQQMWPAEWRRGPGSESPERDIGKDCRLAVAAALDRLASAYEAAPRATQAGLVAVFAAVAEHLPPPLLEQLATLEHDDDSRVAAAALLTGELATGRSMTHEHLAQIAAVDAEALDFLSNAAEGPPRMQAIELVRELAIAAIH